METLEEKKARLSSLNELKKELKSVITSLSNAISKIDNKSYFEVKNFSSISSKLDLSVTNIRTAISRIDNTIAQLNQDIKKMKEEQGV